MRSCIPRISCIPYISDADACEILDLLDHLTHLRCRLTGASPHLMRVRCGDITEDTMKTLTIAQIKGGVGKTTTTVHLARAMACRDQRVLVVDLDPQANASRFLGVDDNAEDKNMGHVLIKRLGHTLEETIRPANCENVWIAPSNLAMSQLVSEFERDGHRLQILVHGLQEVADRFDYCLIDTNPGVNSFTEAALYAADLVLGPLPPEGQADQGFVDLRGVLGELNRFNDNPTAMVGIVTKWDHRTKRTHGVYWQQVEGSQIPLLASRIQKSEIVNQAGMLRATAFDMQASHPICGAFKELADEVMSLFVEEEVVHVA